MLWFALLISTAFADDDSLWGTLDDEEQEDSEQQSNEEEQKIELKIIKAPDTQKAAQQRIQTVPIEVIRVEKVTVRPPKQTLAEQIRLIDKSKFDISIKYTDRVIKWINWYNGEGKPQYQDWQSKLMPHKEQIQLDLQKANIPQDLFYITALSTLPQSPSKTGPWLLSPEMASKTIDINEYLDERLDPNLATMAATQRLKQLYRELGYWNPVMAAYIFGEDLLYKALLQHGTADFWLLLQKDVFSEQQQDQLCRIFAIAIIDKNTDLFPDLIYRGEPPKLAIVIPESTDTVDKIIEMSGLTLETFMELNPHLKDVSSPLYTLDTHFYIPSDKNPLLQQNRTQVKPQPTIIQKHRDSHLVLQNETLQQIAEMYEIPLEDIMSWNDISDALEVQMGDNIQLKPPPPRKWINYSVIEGDTLETIAEQHNVLASQLRKWNGMDEEQEVQLGQQIFIKQPK